MTLSSPLPSSLHGQLGRTLRAYIQESMEPGEQLLPELELARRHGVSRNTVRLALAWLESEHVVHRLHGKGTFVSRRKALDLAHETAGFSQSVQRLGKRPGAQVLAVDFRAPSDEVRQLLDIRTREVFYLQRVRLADSEPWTWEEAVVATDDRRLLEEDWTQASLYGCLERLLNQTVNYTQENLSAVKLNVEQTALLATRPGDPALMVETVAFDQRGTAFVHSTNLRRSDLYQYTITINRNTRKEP